MSALKTEINKLKNELDNPIQLEDELTVQETMDLVEFITFIRENFIKDGKFKINWWALFTNNKILKLLSKVIFPLIKIIWAKITK
jgi:hypothetical protein